MESSGSTQYAICENLASALPGSLTWEWDDRFDGVLAAFAAGEKDRVSAVLADHFPHAWDSVSIHDAPGEISGGMARFGGLHPGQRLYHSGPDREVLLLGLWWPWSNGTTISIRFIPQNLNGSAHELAELHAAMRGIFGLATT